MSGRYSHEREGSHHPVCSVRQQDRLAGAVHMVGSVWEVYPPSPQGCDGGQVEWEEVMSKVRIEVMGFTYMDVMGVMADAGREVDEDTAENLLRLIGQDLSERMTEEGFETMRILLDIKMREES